jgi:hypothetical protein
MIGVNKEMTERYADFFEEKGRLDKEIKDRIKAYENTFEMYLIRKGTNQMKFDLESARKVLKHHNPAMRNRNHFYQKDHPSDNQQWDYRWLVYHSHSNISF